jgi:septal ring factor EnvC (AmiA/AmiB activator)
LVLGAFAQNTREELEEKRKQLLDEIELTSRLLKQTRDNRQATYSTYVTLQRQINRRLKLIRTMQQEVLLLLENVQRTTDVVAALTEDIDRLRNEYGEMVRRAYRQKLTHSDWLFVLSARSFNEAFQRWQYLRQYDRYRQKQARLILDTQETLLNKIGSLEERKKQKERLIEWEQRQSELLGLEISAKNRILEELKGDESRLKRQLTNKEKAAAKLTAAIEKIIREEVAKAEAARKKAAEARTNVSPSSAPSEAAVLSSDFKNNQGRLPWPVQNGVITGVFGRQPHPTIKSVEIVNNGIDIRTDHGAAVKSVFEGTVVGTQFIPGFDYMVILQHGEYYTVYSNLEEVNVRKGQKVSVRQTIGKVNIDRKTNTSEVHFEIWKEKTRLDPSKWVARK